MFGGKSRQGILRVERASHDEMIVMIGGRGVVVVVVVGQKLVMKVCFC